VHVAYVYTGIESIRAPELHMVSQHFLPESYVLLVYDQEQLVGTATVNLDSPAGLPLDADYPAEINDMRQQRCRLVEWGAFAVMERYRHQGVSNLLYMAACSVSTRMLHASHVVIGINPKAVPFYRAVHGFNMLGKAKPHATLAAPVAGMVMEVTQVRAFLRRHYRRPMADGLLPAEHFFGAPLDCIKLPYSLPEADRARWKMPRQVFQALASRRSDVVAAMNPAAVGHLLQSRSRMTLKLGVSTLTDS